MKDLKKKLNSTVSDLSRKIADIRINVPKPSFEVIRERQEELAAASTETLEDLASRIAGMKGDLLNYVKGREFEETLNELARELKLDDAEWKDISDREARMAMQSKRVLAHMGTKLISSTQPTNTGWILASIVLPQARYGRMFLGIGAETLQLGILTFSAVRTARKKVA